MALSGRQLQDIRTFRQLVGYLRDELGWPIEEENFDDLTYEYEPEEIGLDPKQAAKVKYIKQLRPLTNSQPFGIFFVFFEPKRLPVTVIRRILRGLVVKKRADASAADRAAWDMNDLLFLSAYGDDEHRTISFAHFSEDPHHPGDLAALRVLHWEDRDTVLHVNDVHQALKNKLAWPEDPQAVEKWRETWAAAFTLRHREVITTAKQLASRLATLARDIRDQAKSVLAVENKREGREGPLTRQHRAFQNSLLKDLSEDDFADMYAQTVAYGLLSARVSRPAGLTADTIADMIPVTNPFLKELMETFLSAGGRKKDGVPALDFDELGVNEVVGMLRDANMEAVLHDFDDRNPEEDPVIHFYEDFLSEYDRRRRVERGVFYTPKPVVSFIVRSVHQVLQQDFGLEDGLADTATWGDMRRKFPGMKLPRHASPKEPFVQILDPATGTGTFLVEAIDLIHQTMISKWKQEGKREKEIDTLWNRYVPKHLLPRLYGFELMMAPYAVAHMKIGLKLQATGYRFQSDERARIYLTNALEEPIDPGDYLRTLAPALAHETQQANATKRDVPVTVVIGNPPYSGHSANDSEWAARLLRGGVEPSANYFEMDGKPLGERNPKWLNDDYVKFMRYAHWRIQLAEAGVWSFITNHGYLDNPTFRGMRQGLLHSFTNIKVVDLHGNTKKRETAPDGSPDNNVFDIQQGVAVAVFSKEPDTEQCKVQHGDVSGLRAAKYKHLLANTAAGIAKVGLQPQQPFYLFCPENRDLWCEYGVWPSLHAMLAINSVGMVTARDSLTIHWERQQVWQTVQDFAAMEREVARQRFQLGKDVQDWTVELAQKDVRASGPSEKHLAPVLYRPFDTRCTYYTGTSRGFICRPRPGVTRHMLAGDNLGLYTCRQIVSESWRHILPTVNLTDDCYVSNKSRERGYLFPLYRALDADDMEAQGRAKDGRPVFVPNLDREVVERFGSLLGLKWQGVGRGDLQASFAAEDLFYYLYGVLHSPTYRSRYKEFLTRDFARVPLPGALPLFRELGALGERLVTLHLLDGYGEDRCGHQAEMLALLDHAPADYPFVGDDRAVKKVGERSKALAEVVDGVGQVTINSTSYFDRVPEEVWNFHIGGYQVCHKWLADRKKAGRSLSDGDIAHYQKIVVALRETLRLMGEIDAIIEAHGGWPGAFHTGEAQTKK
ncbi:MAG: type ISP restriction/modification enzyme [Candidatus Hydrogenedentota bacterium]